MSRLCCLIIVSLVSLATMSLGHSAFERSEPKNGEVVKIAPRQIQIWFSEPIKVALSTFVVRDAAGKQVDQRDLRADEKQPALVRLSLQENLPAGAYKVTWSAVAQDLHVGKGEFSFQIAP